MSGAGPSVCSLKAVKREVKGFPGSAGSRVPSAQNNPHAKVIHFGKAHLESFQYNEISFSLKK